MQLQVMFWKEGKTYVIKEAITGVTTQGKNLEEAVKNIKEAVSLYLEEMPETKKEMKSIKEMGALNVELA